MTGKWFRGRRVISLPGGNIRDVGLAGQALLAVDDHAAGAAHVDAAGVAEGQGRVLLALQAQQHVQNRGGGLVGDLQDIAVEMTRQPPGAGRSGKS